MFRLLKRLAICLLALGALLLVAWIFRAPLLRGAAQAWIVNDPLTQADAIVVLGGGVRTRPYEAARFYREGYAPQVLVTSVMLTPPEKDGLTTPEKEVARQILLKNGVPEQSLVIIGNGVTSTYDEAVAVREWVTQTKAKRIIIPTDVFHTRRVRWIFGKLLKPVGAEVTVRAVDPVLYGATNWLHHEQGLIDFQNEVIKYAYYRLKY